MIQLSLSATVMASRKEIITWKHISLYSSRVAHLRADSWEKSCPAFHQPSHVGDNECALTVKQLVSKGCNVFRGAASASWLLNLTTPSSSGSRPHRETASLGSISNNRSRLDLTIPVLSFSRPALCVRKGSIMRRPIRTCSLTCLFRIVHNPKRWGISLSDPAMKSCRALSSSAARTVFIDRRMGKCDELSPTCCEMNRWILRRTLRPRLGS